MQKIKTNTVIINLIFYTRFLKSTKLYYVCELIAVKLKLLLEPEEYLALINLQVKIVYTVQMHLMKELCVQFNFNNI